MGRSSGIEQRRWSRLPIIAMGLSLVLIVLSGVGQASRADAFINDGWHCSDSTIEWHFDNSPYTWPSDKKSWVREAINSIEIALDSDGSKLVNIVETTNSGIPVRLNDTAREIRYGEANCLPTATYIWITRHASTRTFHMKVARHEMMHLIGAQHAGRGDSYDGAEDPTTMSTCVDAPDFNPNNVLDRDAQVALNWHHSSLPDRQATANIGFEQGIYAWGAANGTVSSVLSGGATGPKHAAFSAAGTSSDSYVRQTVRMWTGDDGYVDVRASLVARTLANVETNVRAAIYSMEMKDGTSGCGDYQRGLRDPNDRTFGTTVFALRAQSSLTSIGSQWQQAATPWVDLPFRDGWQLQVRAYGNAADDSTVRFDNVRIDEK